PPTIIRLLSFAYYHSPTIIRLLSFFGGRRHFVAAQILADGAAPLLRLRLLLFFRLLLAVDAQGGDRPGQEALEADGLAAGLAVIDGAFAKTCQRARDLAEQELLAVTQPQLGGEQLLLHRFVDGVAADVALAVHAEGQAVLRVAQK